MSASPNYLDGNAAAGELNLIFATDITVAKGRCGNCGATMHFGEVRLYVCCPGLVARCPFCEHILLRVTNCKRRMFLDLSGLTYLSVEMPKSATEDREFNRL